MKALNNNKNKAISARKTLLLAWTPLLIVLIYACLLILPPTRELAIWMLEENRPVELLSFIFAVLGGIFGLILVWQLKQQTRSLVPLLFYLAFAVGFLFLGAEEVAWGQWFVQFETPSAIQDINTQGELTLHNLAIFNDHLEIFPLVFGIAGLIGIWTNRFSSWRKVSAPYILLPWFVIITSISAIDLFQDFIVIQEQFDYLINYLDEVVEMLVAIAGFLYIRLNQKRLIEQRSK